MAKYMRYVSLFKHFIQSIIFLSASAILRIMFLNIVIRNKKEFISVINQLDVQNCCFTISSFHVSTCFEHMRSKHLEAWNKLIVKQQFCTSSWLITEINILKCTVSKTSKYKKLCLTDILYIHICTRRPPIGVIIPEAV